MQPSQKLLVRPSGCLSLVPGKVVVMLCLKDGWLGKVISFLSFRATREQDSNTTASCHLDHEPSENRTPFPPLWST